MEVVDVNTDDEGELDTRHNSSNRETNVFLVNTKNIQLPPSSITHFLSFAGACILDVTRQSGCAGIYRSLYHSVGELAAFLACWLEVWCHLLMVAAAGRGLTHVVEEVVGPGLHSLILDTFGMTPFLDTYPDLMAGGIVMIPALMIAIGMDVSCNFLFSQENVN